MSLYTDNKTNIYGSRERIRSEIATQIKDYLEIQDVDLTQTNFLSYLVNMISVLSSNLMYYNTSIYKEFFFTEAQLPESVLNLGKWIDYTPTDATPAIVDILFMIPLNNINESDVSFIIPQDYYIKAGEIPFKLAIDTIRGFVNLDNVNTESDVNKNLGINISILNNASMKVYDNEGVYYPVKYNVEANVAMFLLPFKQEEVVFDSFIIPNELEFFQFYNKKIEYQDRQLSGVSVYVNEDPDSLDLLPSNYEEFKPYMNSNIYTKWDRNESGIYTLAAGDKKYIWTSAYGSGDILFGNGIIGYQPPRNSHICIIAYTTKGSNGMIIPNSITKSDPIYYESDGGLVKIPLGVSNPVSSINGTDSPTIEEMKSQALVKLRSRDRLVSDGDYDDINTILSDLPVGYSKPILKRSDLKINEMTIFNTLIYYDADSREQLVPTRNVTFPWYSNTDSTSNIQIDSTSNISISTYIPSKTSVNDDIHYEWESIFDMELDINTMSVKYYYVANELMVPVTLHNSYITDSYINDIPYASLNITYAIITKIYNSDIVSDSEMLMTFGVNSEEDDMIDYQIEITTDWNNYTYTWTKNETHATTNDSGEIDFTFNELMLKDIPSGLQRYDIKLYAKRVIGGSPELEHKLIKSFYMNATLKKDLYNMMYSSASKGVDSDGTEFYSIYDVPVIYSEYFNETNFDQTIFDSYVLHKLVTNMKVTDIRMITDSINIKFCDTYGALTNMNYNKPNKIIITRSLYRDPNEDERNFNDLYIVNGGEGYDEFGNYWLNHIHEYVKWNGMEWIFIKPTIGDMVMISNPDPLEPENGKKLVYTGKRWIVPEFDIPLKISLNVVKDSNISIGIEVLKSNIKTNIISHFESEFGMDKNIDRSEIIKIVRTVSGVNYVELLEPECDIIFNYNIDKDLSTNELLEYTPQLVMMSENSITINIVSHI